MIEVASLRYGVIFKKAFCQPHIFTAFVKDFTGVEIEIDTVETEKSFYPIVGKVDGRFDLFAENKKNRIIIEIQHQRFPDHYDRFLHYHCMALIEQAKKSDNYRPYRRVLSLVVLTSGDRHKTDVAITDFEPKDSEGRGIGETQYKLIYICPKYVNANTKAIYREWLEAIDDSLDHQVDEEKYQRPIIQDLFKTIKEDKTTPQEYARMKDEYSNEEYHQKKYQEGMDAGIKQNEQQLRIEKRAKEKANREKEKANQEREKEQVEKERLIKLLKQAGLDY